MRAVILCILSVLVLASCNTLRQAGEVASKLSQPPSREQLSQPSGSMRASAREMPGADYKSNNQKINEMVDKAMAGQLKDATPANATPPPPDQEISVNLIYAGYKPAAKSKNLDFDFKALWGDYKYTDKPAVMQASIGKTDASLDLGIAHLHVVPRIVSNVRGHYQLTLTDRTGALIGSFEIADSGQQVDIQQSPTKYDTQLIYFHPERRLTGYAVYKAGTMKPEMGVIFVGKGWSFVENSKKPDMSKGYLFPEVDMVVLPKEWMENHDMSATCNTLKRGNEVAGGVCYS